MACHVLGSQVMKEEAFLRYRREVVRSWPESPRKVVLLYAIEGRIAQMRQESQNIIKCRNDAKF
jgi:hypothetical protein